MPPIQTVEFDQVRSALLSAFEPAEFDQLLHERLKFDRSTERIADGPFDGVLTQVLMLAQGQGWYPLLIAEAAVWPPRKRSLQRMFARYAEELVSEAEQRVAKRQSSYRPAPLMIIQTRGKAEMSAAVPATQTGFERIIRPNLGSKDAALWRQQWAKHEGRVCQVELDGSPKGTAFLVGPDTLLTAYHVLRDVLKDHTLAPKVKFRFDYAALPDGTRTDGTIVSLHQTEWFVDGTSGTIGEANRKPKASVPEINELDFALLKIERALGNELLTPEDRASRRGWITLPIEEPPIPTKPPMPLLILQHPESKPLQFTLDTQAVLGFNSNRTRIHYATNTEPGASGSPCFNWDWKLIALHQYADVEHNQGTPVKMIRDRLKREGKESALGGPID